MSVRTEALFEGSERPALRASRPRFKSLRKKIAAKSDRWFIYLLLLHVPLGVAMYVFSPLTIIHPIIVLALGFYRAAQKSEPIERVAYVAAYIVGVEVLLRMAGSPAPWELGKYGSVAIMVFALACRGFGSVPRLPMLYLVLLLPSCLVTLFDHGLELARTRLSFNMSGPICLFVSCWFFSQVRLTEDHLKRLLLSLMVPVISVAFVTLFFTVTTPVLEFTTESNKMTSGGFGPNQVSAVLGLGAFIAASFFLLFKRDIRSTIVIGGLALLFTAQSVLTFSRGGMYTAIGALVVIAIFQARDIQHFLGRLLPVVLIGAIFMVFIFPSLNTFTGGKLEERFESSDTTNRIGLLEEELEVFLQHPVFGVGVGEAMDERFVMTQEVALSHTEFSRILSEHGSLGVIALLCLLAASVINLRKQKQRLGKAFVAGCVAWSGLFMLNAGMRLAAPAFMFGMSFLIVTSPAYGSAARRVRSLRPRRKHLPVDEPDSDAMEASTKDE